MKKVILILSSMILLSCERKVTTIEEGDDVTICVIDSVWSKQSISTLEFEPTYFYRTTCNNTLITKKYQSYQKGDTIKFVKKNKK